MKVRCRSIFFKKQCYICHREINKEHYWLMDVPFPAVKDGYISTYVCTDCERKIK